MFSDSATHFKKAIKDLIRSLPQGFKVKVVLWRPETGEEWEITPVSSIQTKFPYSAVKCEVKT